MRVSELARRTGTTVRALRYYESLGLVVPGRADNGYREYEPIAVALVTQIRELTALGLHVEETRPFVECLQVGHDDADVCPASLATYRRAIHNFDDRIQRLSEQRRGLQSRLEAAAERCVSTSQGQVTLPTQAADPRHLPGRQLGSMTFPATDGTVVDLGRPATGRFVVFVYPLTGRPGVDLPEGFEEFPGARGCTEQACGFRDRHQALLEAGASRVLGLSAQSRAYQRELAHRLGLPFVLLSDVRFTAAQWLGLPTFNSGGLTFYQRLTLILLDGVVEHVFTDIPEPARHADQVVDWLRERTSP